MKITFNIRDASCRSFDLCRCVDLSQEAIQREQRLLRCDQETARKYGGPITQVILDTIGSPTLRVDVRVHHLKTGEIPARTTGWHCDFPIPGSGVSYTFNLERDLQVLNYLFVSGPPPTEFLEASNFELEFEQRVTPETINRAIEARQRITQRYRSLLPTHYAEPGRIHVYNPTELHRPTPWTGREPTWRYFFRATYFPKGDPLANCFENRIGLQVIELRKPQL